MSKKLTVFEKNQLKVAKDTLRMPSAMLGIMGGMSKEEARRIVERLEKKESEDA